MKRIISAVLLAVVLLSLCSCGGKPKNVSDAMYQIGENALSVADDYINGSITGENVAERMHEFMKQADAQYKKECKDFGQDTLVGTEYSNDYFINSSISILYFKVSNAKSGNAVMSDVKEARNSLAKHIGK